MHPGKDVYIAERPYFGSGQQCETVGRFSSGRMCFFVAVHLIESCFFIVLLHTACARISSSRIHGGRSDVEIVPGPKLLLSVTLITYVNSYCSLFPTICQQGDQHLQDCLPLPAVEWRVPDR